MLKKVHESMGRITNRLNSLSRIILGVIVGSMLVIIVMQVILRYLFNTGFTWPEEVTTFLMAWMTFLGSAIALKQSEHISLELFVGLLPKKIYILVRFISRILVFSFILLFTYLAFNFALGSLSYSANTVDISLFWPRVSIFVSSLLMIIYTIEFILGDVREVLEK